MGTTISIPSSFLEISNRRSEERLINDGFILENGDDSRHRDFLIQFNIPKNWKAFDLSREKGIITWCLVDEESTRRWLLSGPFNENQKRLYLYNLGFKRKYSGDGKEISTEKCLSLFKGI